MKNDYSMRKDDAPVPTVLPPMLPVISSQIESIGYDAACRILFIKFIATEATYAYYEVPDNVFEAFKAAESHGKFMNAEIRNKYPYKKL